MCGVLVGKTEGKRPLRGTRHRKKERNIGKTRTDLPQDRNNCWFVVNAAINIWVPPCREFLE